MRWSFQLLRIYGISIELHLTFVLFFMFLAMAGVSAFLFFTLIFSVVLAHELVHSMTAIFHGIRVPRITLLPIGGLASIELPRDPSLEIKVSIAGPLFNFVLAGICFLMLFAIGTDFIGFTPIIEGLSAGDFGMDSFSSVLSVMIYMNLMLGAFNLLPAFPMDGGRVFRGVLALWMDYAGATRIATLIGQVIFIGLAFIGILQLNILLVIIGIFLSYAGSSEMRFVSITQLIGDLKFADIAVPGIRYASCELDWTQFMDTVYRRGESLYIIVDEMGVVTDVIDTAMASPRSAAQTLAETKGVDFKVIDGGLKVADNLKDLLTRRVILVTEEGRLLGYVTSDKMNEALSAIALKKRIFKRI